MERKEYLTLEVQRIEDISKKNLSNAVVNAVQRAKDALEQYNKAAADGKTEEMQRLDEEISDFVRYISLLDVEQPCQGKSDKIFGISALTVSYGCIFGFIFWYVGSSATKPLSTIESVRPILVMAAIISTIIFGGTLIVAALFSTEGSFNERFRRAREIFLVFSGIFGTVFGFYFGAGESKPQLIFDATRNNNTVTAYASGGTPPYKVTAGKDTQEVKDGFASFQLDLSQQNKDIVVSAIDSRGLQGTKTLKVSNENGVAGQTGATGGNTAVPSLPATGSSGPTGRPTPQ